MNIVFETPEGMRSKAILNTGENLNDSEVIEFIEDVDNVNIENIAELIYKQVEINLNKFPQFYTDCKVPPSGLVVSAANHPDVIKQTEKFEKSENPTMEELLYEQIRLLNGVTDNQARKMANTEALNMGELNSLETAQEFN